MSASDLKARSINPLSTGAPTFSWSAKGGSVYFPNDTFTLLFYDGNEELIFETSTLNRTNYTPTTSEWNSIVAATGKTYFVMIKSWALAYYSSGPYYSSMYSFNKPVDLKDDTLHQKKDDALVPQK